MADNDDDWLTPAERQGIASISANEGAPDELEPPAPGPSQAPAANNDAPSMDPAELEAWARTPSTDQQNAPPPLVQQPTQPGPPMQSPAAKALADPSFAQFVGQRAKALSDLKAAQGKADQARGWQDVANDFVRAGDVAAGRKTDEAALQAKLDAANRPVENLLQQQQLGQQQTKGALEDSQLAGSMQQQAFLRQTYDPTSPVSQRSGQMALRMGMIKPEDLPSYSADMFEPMLKGANLVEAKREHDMRLQLEARKEQAAGKRQDKQIGLQQSELGERARHNQADENLARGKLSLRPLGPPELSELQSYVDATDAIDQLKAQQNKAGVVGTALGVGEGGVYNQMKSALADSLSKAESRGRTNPGAAAKIAAEIPSGVARAPQANAWFDTKRQQLVGNLENRVKELKSSGIAQGEIAGFEEQLARLKQGAPTGGASSAHPQDAAALQWAKSNPSDPRAVKILQLNGGAP